ncbi:hypothetical protein B0H16DRAFT_1476090 [Mycena metata]|uniref:Uncharacterized protein n=1 Tax=Mycena metata TaxID=1033252 RepID=A0AAD7HD27_9AGAR|nr:hypothetical protein B0H16DRAFT_1476090 [Mycena metata]
MMNNPSMQPFIFVVAVSHSKMTRTAEGTLVKEQERQQQKESVEKLKEEAVIRKATRYAVPSIKVIKEAASDLPGKQEYFGFIPVEEMIEITPGYPGDNSTNVLCWKLLNNIPKVQFDKEVNVQRDPKDLRYILPQYRGLLDVDAPELDDGARFVFFGGKPSVGVYRYMYMRSVDLQKRLQENCIDVYTTDSNGLKSPTPTVPFKLWNPNGTLGTHAETFKRLVLTSAITSKDIFSEYCDLVRAATYVPTKPWDVTARFWDRKVTGVVLYFRHSEGIDREDFRKCIQDTITWTTKDKLRFCPSKEFVISDWNDGIFKSKDWVCIGGHPLQIYETWVKKTTLDTMKGLQADPWRSPSLDEISVVLPTSDSSKVLWNPNYAQAKETITQVTAAKVRMAKMQPRITSQQRVMGGSATVVAEAFGWKDAKNKNDNAMGKAEWLHRSAYSYGGLGTGVVMPSSSQDPGNLIFGTKETNTLMLRTEIFIKRFTKRADVKVHTEVVPFIDKAGKPIGPPWLAKQLKYTYWATAKDPKIKNVRTLLLFPLITEPAQWALKVEFLPFARILPTKFELYLDLLVGKALYKDAPQEDEDEVAQVADEEEDLIPEILVNVEGPGAPLVPDSFLSNDSRRDAQLPQGAGSCAALVLAMVGEVGRVTEEKRGFARSIEEVTRKQQGSDELADNAGAADDQDR